MQINQHKYLIIKQIRHKKGNFDIFRWQNTKGRLKIVVTALERADKHSRLRGTHTRVVCPAVAGQKIKS